MNKKASHNYHNKKSYSRTNGSHSSLDSNQIVNAEEALESFSKFDTYEREGIIKDENFPDHQGNLERKNDLNIVKP